MNELSIVIPILNEAKNISRLIPQINQVYIFFKGELKNKAFHATEESLDVRLFNEKDIPWSELAFPMIEVALDRYFSDRANNVFPVFREEIRRPWTSKRSTE